MSSRIPLALLSVLLAASPAAGQRAPGGLAAANDSLDRMAAAVDALTRRVWPSVVQIMVTSYGAREEGARGEANVVLGRQQSLGSGFVIDADGYIMTNAHVVSGAQRVQVLVPPTNADGSLAMALSAKQDIRTARIVGITTELDLALLKVDGLKTPPLPLATYSQLNQGSWVFAFGSPGGLRNTLTHGIVSAVARQVDPDSPQIYIQTDAPINPGNSGGPLVNIHGEVVGVNTFIISPSGGSDGLGFAIPSATVRTVFKQLKQYGQIRRQDVGMGVQTITQAMADSLSLSVGHGVIVSDVLPGGPADTAGMKVGDILKSIDGQPAENVPTVMYYFRLRDSADPVKIVVTRGTGEQTLSVKAVEERNEFDAVSAQVDPIKNLVDALGIIGIEIDANIAAAAKGLRDPFGIIVIARAAGATSDVPLLAKDVIRGLNGRPTTTLDGLRELMKAVKPGAPVTLQIQRDGRLMYVSFTHE
jgi:serine protease Do